MTIVFFLYTTVADVLVTSPAFGTEITGGSTISISWQESGRAPPVADLTSYIVYLCAGGNDRGSFDCSLAVLVDGWTFTQDEGSITVPIPPDAGASAANA